MKQEYTPAELEIVQFMAEDVISGSPLTEKYGLPIDE